MSSPIKACSPAPYSDVTAGGSDVGHAVMSKKLWPVGKNLTYYFLDGTANQRAAVTDTIKTWVQYANITFDNTSAQNSADLRISFKGQGSWSTIGIDASKVDDGSAQKTNPTLNLGWLADVNPPTASDRATILHEFGHVLGMMHEHQSPARGERIHLKELAVYNYYRPLLGNNNALVKTQVIDQYNLSSISNFSHLDLNSIMMYFMPASLNEEGVDVPVNLDLSEMDKAFITLNYPRNPTNADGMSILQALNIANVPSETSAVILDFVQQGKLEEARNAFSDWNMGVMTLHSINKLILNDVDTSQGAQFGIRESIGKVINNPTFRGAVKNIMKTVFEQRDIPTVMSIPGSAPRDLRNIIGTVITTPSFAKAIHDINTDFTGNGTKNWLPGPPIGYAK